MFVVLKYYNNCIFNQLFCPVLVLRHRITWKCHAEYYEREKEREREREREREPSGNSSKIPTDKLIFQMLPQAVRCLAGL